MCEGERGEERGRERERESKGREREGGMERLRGRKRGERDISENFNTVMIVCFYLLDSTSKSCQRLTKLHQELQQKT